jgi:hypothetical protein
MRFDSRRLPLPVAVTSHFNPTEQALPDAALGRNTEDKGWTRLPIEQPIDVHDSGRVGGPKANLHDETSVFVPVRRPIT